MFGATLWWDRCGDPPYFCFFTQPDIIWSLQVYERGCYGTNAWRTNIIAHRGEFGWQFKLSLKCDKVLNKYKQILNKLHFSPHERFWTEKGLYYEICLWQPIFSSQYTMVEICMFRTQWFCIISLILWHITFLLSWIINVFEHDFGPPWREDCHWYVFLKVASISLCLGYCTCWCRKEGVKIKAA